MQPLRWTANYLGIATYLRIFRVVNRNPCPFIASLPGLRYLAVLDILESGMKLVPQAHDAVFELSNFFRMALTSIPLRILDLSAMSESLSFRDLRDIATHLPAIEILRVRLRRDCIPGTVVSRPYFHLSFSEKRNQRFAEISLVESCCAIILFSLVQ